MMTMHLDTGLQVASGVAGLVASGLWLKACFVSVPYLPVEHDGWIAAAILKVKGDRQIDIEASDEQSKMWNAAAAAVTGVAALLQVASTFASLMK